MRRPFEPGQYTSTEFTDLLAEHNMLQSLSRPRQCWDNAVAESFFSSLKVELVDRRTWATRAQARRSIFEYIAVFYSRRRLHSSLGYLSPVYYRAIGGDRLFSFSARPGVKPLEEISWEAEERTRHRGLPDVAVVFQLRGVPALAQSADVLGLLPSGERSYRFDPVPTWERVRQPVLLVYGELDKSVPPAVSALRIGAALERGGNGHLLVGSFHAASHEIILSPDGYRDILPLRWAAGYWTWSRTGSEEGGGSRSTSRAGDRRRVERLRSFDTPCLVPARAAAGRVLGGLPHRLRWDLHAPSGRPGRDE